MEKMSYANTNQKNAGVAVLALDKAGLEPGEGKQVQVHQALAGVSE